MTGADNISVVLYRYLRTLSVKVSRDTVHRLLSTPLGGGMRGISDALDALHIKNEVFRDQRKNLRVFFFKHTTSSVYIKRMPYLLPL